LTFEICRVNRKMATEDRLLWMGDLEPYMDALFIENAFRQLGESVNVRMAFDRNGNAARYCFIEMPDSATARRVMLTINGTDIPNSKTKFNLSYANNSNSNSVEYSLFVNNLSSQINDAELYQIFGKKFISCRGAKVYRGPDGRSRCMGFVRFSNETEQQQALVEMNRKLIRGKKIMLRIAPVKPRARQVNRCTTNTTTTTAAAAEPGVSHAYHYDHFRQAMQAWQGLNVGCTPFVDQIVEYETSTKDTNDLMRSSEELYMALEQAHWYPKISSNSSFNQLSR
ncbi:tRNA selenocysteine 1-associated protein 1, partial [Trichinella zimbabwensis]